MNDKNCRIVEVTNVDGTKEWLIQHRHFLFKWKWVYAQQYFESGSMDWVFYSLKEAKKNLCYFDGSVPTFRVLSDTKNKK